MLATHSFARVPDHTRPRRVAARLHAIVTSIAHGLRPFADVVRAEPPARTKLRVLVLGRVAGGKGEALLRSLVIAPDLRGRGAGRYAAKLILKRASEDGARSAYLLTESAAPFFEKVGFTRIERADAPASIRETRQAASICSSSAAMMTMRLSA